ncbi:suppressor of lurcher protein 1-like [Penaeus japonicus]|uniref:suppressor of lurcher protein 1-like n=1 Tax=Penaeus japonicus TaxID=27405 RepID=UPI001C70D279|nr:suppressor of lurcher protein 1-like [Penaeus japonicus]XP_042867566.1 suppressor of lurcher protein 1-like [Penaeus japonicus]
MRRLLALILLAAAGSPGAASLTHAVSRRCNDTISSMFEREGVVTSPGFPSRYDPHANCFFSFVGARHQRVQIIFTEFNLKEPPEHLRPHERCLHTDWVAVYNVINGSSKQEIDHFCGTSVPNSVMSATSGLQLVFKSGNTRPTEKDLQNPRMGFSARFKFVSDLGLTSGRQKSDGKCHFVFNSTEARNGTVYSPNPEGFYPLDTTCVYIFYGLPGEIVRIIFKYFDVEGVLPCNSDSDSDYLEFSNFPSADRKIPTFCGFMAPNVIHSDSSYFRMTFRSNSKFGGTGFAADYQFLDNSRHPFAIKRVIGAAFTGGEGHQSQANLLLVVTVASLYIFRTLHFAVPL